MRVCALLLLAVTARVTSQSDSETERPTVPEMIDFKDLPLYLQELFSQPKGSLPFGPNTNNPTGHGIGSFSMGWPGIPGKPGMNGRNGLPGLMGVKGERGPRGHQGRQGPAGPMGIGSRGPKGDHGEPGEVRYSQGPRGLKGEPGRTGMPGQSAQAMWKQCAWMEESDMDAGIIKNCTFVKKSKDTSLRVAFSGNLRVGGCVACCKRWFFAFNRKECSSPVPIDASFYVAGPAYQNPLRPRYIEGYCDRLDSGPVTVSFNVGSCKGSHTEGDAYTGWNSASRIVIEEVPAPQA